MDLLQTFIILLGIINTVFCVNLFDSSIELCCSGQIHPLPTVDNASTTVGSRHYCCGGEMYNDESHMCCQNTVVSRPPKSPRSLWSCCGSMAFDATTALCCDGAIIEDARTLNVNNASEENLNAESDDVYLIANSINSGFNDNHLLCCGAEAYDWRMDMCCYASSRAQPLRGRRTTLVKQRPNPQSECCNGQPYDIRNEMCCAGNVQTSKESGSNQKLFCCADRSYNPVTSVCCDGKSLPKSDGENANYACCGDSLRNLATQMCCHNTVISVALNDTGKLSCCGNSTFDPEMELCCNGVAHDRDEDGLACCGTEVYKPGKGDICCGNVVQKMEGNNNASRNVFPVCCGNNLIADAKREMCCDGLVVARTSSRARCCGQSAMDADKNICCMRKIMPKTSPGDACCGEAVYDSDAQVCCFENESFNILQKINGNKNRSLCCATPRDAHF